MNDDQQALTTLDETDLDAVSGGATYWMPLRCGPTCGKVIEIPEDAEVIQERYSP